MSIMSIRRATRKNDEPAYTPEAAKALASLESYAGRGWDLTNLGTDDLEAIEADIEILREGRCDTERRLFSYSSTLISSAREALRTERLHRQNERDATVREQRKRVSDITAAAAWTERAEKLMQQAEAIEDKWYIIPRNPIETFTAEQAQAMDDEALKHLWDMKSRQADQEGSALDEHEHNASVLEKHGGARGKRLAKVLRSEAELNRERLQAYRAAAATARAELDARAKRAENMRQAMDSVPDTTATVAELLSRVADLESKLASDSQQ